MQIGDHPRTVLCVKNPVVVLHHDINGFQAIADLIEEKLKQVIGGDVVRTEDQRALRDANLRFAPWTRRGDVDTLCLGVPLDGGQFQAAVLTGCLACRSSYCAGLR